MPDQSPKASGPDSSRAHRGSEWPVPPTKPAHWSLSEYRPSPASGGDTEQRPVSGRPPAHGSRGVSPDPNPRSVTPGIENQTPEETPPKSPRVQCPEPGVWVSLDWMRIVAPESHYLSVIEILQDTFGEPSGHSGGAMWFKRGTDWHPGVTLSSEHRLPIIQVDIRGERLRSMGTDAALELLRRLYDLRSVWATRFDGAVDFVGQGREIHTSALASCRAGQLCLRRRFADDSEFTSDGEPKRRLLKLGKRESAICVRIYDKGLETKSAPVGHWERIEAEFKEDRAQTLALRLLENPDTWPEQLAGAVVASIDFRLPSERSEIERRERSAWWADVLRSFEARPIKPDPPPSSLQTYFDWIWRSVTPRLLQFCDLLEVDFIDLMSVIRGEAESAKSVCPAVIELRSAVRQGDLPGFMKHYGLDRKSPRADLPLDA